MRNPTAKRNGEDGDEEDVDEQVMGLQEMLVSSAATFGAW